jgi:hypothetical protein
VESILDAAEAGASQADPQVSVTRESAEETMELARQEVEEQIPPEIPKNPLFTGVFLFLLEPSALVRCFVLALALLIESGAILTALSNMSGGPLAQFLSAMLMAFSVLFGLITFGGWSVTMLAVLQETSNGNDRIEDWPENNVYEWVADSAYVFFSLFFGLLPGVMFGQILLLTGGDTTAYASGIAVSLAVSAFFFFPISLVSTLEAGSPMNVVSRPVWRSLTLIPHRWAQFYLLTAGLLVLFVIVSWARVLGSTFLNYLVAVIQLVIMMVYFRYLGRLTWCCQEALIDVERERESSPEEE